MQIYTRGGDKGSTALMGGERVPKDSPRIEAIGTIDELNSWVGFIVSTLTDWPEAKEELIKIQHYLFDAGNDFSTPQEKYPYHMKEDATLWLEARLDAYSKIPKEVTSFILPGGSIHAGQLHYARTLARRAERRCVTFIQTDDFYNPEALKFINRLSDYFFVLARVANVRENKEDVLYSNSPSVFHNELTKDDIYKEGLDLDSQTDPSTH